MEVEKVRPRENGARKGPLESRKGDPNAWYPSTGRPEPRNGRDRIFFPFFLSFSLSLAEEEAREGGRRQSRAKRRGRRSSRVVGRPGGQAVTGRTKGSG